MEHLIIDTVKVCHDPRITYGEIDVILSEEKLLYSAKGKQLGYIELTLDGEEIIVSSKSREPINRIRRITGYLSKIDNFNDGKKAELTARRTHETPN